MSMQTDDQLKARAWEIYCAETAGSMDVRDHWEELSPRVRGIFLAKAEEGSARREPQG